MSETTTAPAPMIAPSPIVTASAIMTFAPIQTSFPMRIGEDDDSAKRSVLTNEVPHCLAVEKKTGLVLTNPRVGCFASPIRQPGPIEQNLPTYEFAILVSSAM